MPLAVAEEGAKRTGRDRMHQRRKVVSVDLERSGVLVRELPDAVDELQDNRTVNMLAVLHR